MLCFVLIVIPRRRYTRECVNTIMMDMLENAVRTDKVTYSLRLVTPTPSKRQDQRHKLLDNHADGTQFAFAL